MHPSETGTGAFDLGRHSIRRGALLDVLATSRPKILALVAPAGFGKSTLVRQLLDRGGIAGVCDCTSVSCELDFARRIVPVLAEQEPDSGATLAQTELMLADGAMSPAQGAVLAISAWRAPSSESTFVFENAEHLATQPAARDLLTRLLGDLPENRSIVICSREPLRIHLSRFAPPHRIMTLRAEQLAFTRAEIEEILVPLGAPGAMVDRIVRLSQGWPIAVFLLARFLQEGRLAKLLDDLNDVAFEDLHDYLADQVLGELEPDILETILAASVIPNATRDDLVVATGSDDAVRKFVAFEKVSPFVTRSEAGTFDVHPLVATMLREREPERRRELLDFSATEYERKHDYVRSAELHMASGSQADAARILERVMVADDHAPSMRYARILASLDRALIQEYPTLWSCGAVLQMFATDSEKLLEENTRVLSKMPRDLAPQKQYFIYVTRVLLLGYLGRFDEAYRTLERLVPRATVPSFTDDTLRGYALYLHGTVRARMGFLAAAESDLVESLPLVESMYILGSAVLMMLAADVERVHGRREKEKQLLDRAIAIGNASGLSNIIAQRYAEATFGAWLAGEDDCFAENLAQLAAIVDERGVRGFAFFTDRARRGFATEPNANDILKWVVCGHLVAYGDANDAAQAAGCARAALDAARIHSTPHLIALAALAFAEVCGDAERPALHGEARKAADAIESEAFKSAVDLAIAGSPDVGILNAYFARRVRVREGPPPPRLEVEILRGAARTRGVAVTLPERELALLLALASRRQPTPRETLTESLWPEHDDVAARNALHVCLHRLRLRLGDDAFIVRTAAGYRLCDDARVDLWDIHHSAATIRSRETLSEREVRELEQLLRRLHFEDAGRYQAWEWFRSVERRVHELRSEISQRLGTLALAQDRLTEALALAQQTIERDPCDEPAHELAVEVFLRKGDRAAALRQFRHYRDTLWEELRCAPSARIATLVGAAASP